MGFTETEGVRSLKRAGMAFLELLRGFGREWLWVVEGLFEVWMEFLGGNEVI